ncbi:MAG: excinuclease ABC subunit UvrC [Candidatus Methanoperedens sp.]|jgi:excinuclease ABC subunit C|nr:excinuclease ABC subunit UvrC [Candidatus Methanoperedens sp.]PKL52965.1 MAG: excinuclease ABC subunit C [Candidatus Methanoperedenaceae archaeon HGW-Methanoperedenaceae-1]
MPKTIEDARKLPDSTGVYIMKDREENIIYVGKAASLRDRVSSYFREQDSPKTRILVKNIEDFEYIVTGNEVEALVLESNLIKEHMPRYNVRLRDDKHYPYIKITNEEFPHICIARRRSHDGGQYFGPYPGSKAVRELIKMASGFGIRRCRKKLPCPPCLNYHIKQCAAPCLGKVTEKEYRNIISDVTGFLEGKRSQLIRSLEARMEELSDAQEYEKAARVRDQVHALRELSEKQRVNVEGNKEQDVIAAAISGNTAVIQIFHISEGSLRGRDTISVNTAGADEVDVLSGFVKQYYQDIPPPQEIIVPVEIEDASIARWLSGNSSRLKTARSQTEKGLMNLALENARMIAGQNMLREARSGAEALSALRNALSLPVVPVVIEAFDISNTSGTDAVGSLVAFEDGEPDKKNYRRFGIKTVEGADDTAMIREVVARAYTRRRDEGKRMPDLVLIDGGRGQLNAAISALDDVGLGLSAASIAKQFEHIFIPGRDAPVILPKDSPELLLVRRIRDEAHRFAVAYHRKLRGRKMQESVLDDIEGVGAKRKRALLLYFGSVEMLKKAELPEIEKVPGISGKVAGAVWGCFHKANFTK